MEFLCALWSIVCALLNRIRGGMFGNVIKNSIPFWSTTTARLTTTLIMTLPIIFSHGWLIYLLSWLLLYVGFIFGWKAWQDMDSIPKDIISLGVRGIVLSGPIGILTDNYILALCGLTMGLLYYIGKFLPITQELDGSKTSNVTWGEYLFGAVLGVCLCIKFN